MALNSRNLLPQRYLGGCVSRATSYHRQRPMSHHPPSNAEPIRLIATRSHRKARNPLISQAFDLNLMPFTQEPYFLLHRIVYNYSRGNLRFENSYSSIWLF
jgi:hypothetical protein